MFFFTLFACLWLSTPAVFADQRELDYTFTVGNAVLAPDGFSRSTVTVNGQFPGPLISANKGDTVNVNVVNGLIDPTMRRSTSIHWHGILQNKNGYNDGPSFVTQCPIAPEHSYQYSLQLGNQAGTYWYHSHLSSQYLDGLRGPIVIQDPNDPHLSLYDVDDETTVIVLADWFHTLAPVLTAQYLSTNNTRGAEQLPQSGTINGVGRTSTDPAPARPVFTVTPGKRYRFRIINASAISRFDFQIQGHNFTVIEADGESHQPLTVDRLTIYAGQRYSVVLNANQPVDNYWIRAPMTAHVGSTPPPNWATDSDNVNAVLRYDGAPEVEPTSTPPALTGNALDESQLVPLGDAAAPGEPYIGGADKVFNMTFTASMNQTGWGFQLNGVRYVSPDVPTLLKILSGARNDSDFSTAEDTHVIKRGDVVEINISGTPGHPFHLHGHTFSVVKGATGVANFGNAPRRDTTITGTSPITIRFVADNPGPWFLHCHIDLHLEGGLAAVFAEDPDDIVSGPDQIAPSDDWKQLCPIYESLSPECQ